MKHIAMDYHSVSDKVQNGELRVFHVSTNDQLVDALTKPLTSARIQGLHFKIGVLSPTILRGHNEKTPKELTVVIYKFKLISFSVLDCYVLTQKRSTYGNRRVSLSRSQFSRLHSRARKVNGIQFILNLINYPNIIV